MLSARVTKWFIALVTQAFIFGGLAQAKCSGPPSLVDRGHEVYDTETDLTWAKCSVGMKWTGGKCIGVVTLGSWAQANEAKWPEGWRVPSPEELKTILATKCEGLAIDESLFPKTYRWYWTNRGNASSCSVFDFFYLQSDSSVDCAFPGAVRLVRGGQ